MGEIQQPLAERDDAERPDRSGGNGAHDRRDHELATQERSAGLPRRRRKNGMNDWRRDLAILRLQDAIPYVRIEAAAKLAILGVGLACGILTSAAFVILTIYWSLGS